MLSLPQALGDEKKASYDPFLQGCNLCQVESSRITCGFCIPASAVLLGDAKDGEVMTVLEMMDGSLETIMSTWPRRFDPDCFSA